MPGPEINRRDVDQVGVHATARASGVALTITGSELNLIGAVIDRATKTGTAERPRENAMLALLSWRVASGTNYPGEYRRLAIAANHRKVSRSFAARIVTFGWMPTVSEEW